MTKKSYTIIDKAGLHARPASILSRIASKYLGEVNIIYNGKNLTLKSIMIVMSLGIPYNASFDIEVIGENEIELLQQFTDTLKQHGMIE
ncbi:MAG: HPr family phosphocarrier protein [Firmicutes bacterium]|nr:HPr family phosphocarrier protein [Bacillota bacterium]